MTVDQMAAVTAKVRSGDAVVQQLPGGRYEVAWGSLWGIVNDKATAIRQAKSFASRSSRLGRVWYVNQRGACEEVT